MNKGEEKKTAPPDVKISLTKRKEKKDKQRRLIRLVIFISSVSVIILIILMTLLLKISNVDVTGNGDVSKEEIIRAAQADNGKNILTFNTGEAEKRIRKEFPAFSEVNIKKKLPSKILIEVKKADEIFYTAVGEKYYSLDSDLKVIDACESMEEAEIRGLIRIYFPNVIRCIAGENIMTKDTDIGESAKQLYSALEKYELLYEVSEIDLRDKFDIRLKIGVKYEVKLGNILECDTKIEILCGMIKVIDPNEVGTIDFSYGEINKPVFIRS